MAAQLTPAQVRDSFDPGQLSLILLPTERCNFRCTYCYEKFKQGGMRNEVVQGVKSLLSRRIPTLHTLNISWFGGEPLLSLPIIEDLSHHIVDSINQDRKSVV